MNEPSRRSDVAVFVRLQDSEAQNQAKTLKAQGVAIVVDLCVNHFVEADGPGPGRRVDQQTVTDCLKMVSLADVVTTASTYIADQARRHHDRVVYLPDSIDPIHFNRRKNKSDFERRTLRAIWSGVSIKGSDLVPLLPILFQSGIELTVISESAPDLRFQTPRGERRFDYTFHRWTYETFPDTLLEGEICVSPRVTTTEYNSGHSNFKIGVFLSSGVPALASPLPSYREILEANDCGALCDTADCWLQQLTLINTDRSVLAAWSEGAVLAMKPYSTERVSNSYSELFNSLL